MVKISDAVSSSYNILKNNVSNPRLEAELIVSHVLQKDRIYITIHKDDLISCEDAEKISRDSSLRAEGMPFAYITGKKEFMSLEFYVDSNVLIPRPETEELVSLIADMFKGQNIKLLDLCTGSGAIAISCAKYLPGSICHGVDISKEAVKIAKHNAKMLDAEDKTDFWEYDVLSSGWNYGTYDVVVSNPPYIEKNVIDTLDKTVKAYEPRIALDGGDDGLVFYRKIIEDTEKYLKKNGMIFFETGYNQGRNLKSLMNDKFCSVRIIKDYSGNDRIACGILK